MDFSSRLPLDLLQKVFRHYLSDRKIPVQSLDHSDGLWVLGQVSSTWRCATLSDSTFWSSINGRFAHPYDHPSNTIDLSETLKVPFLTPLSLSLHFPISRPPKTIPSTWRTFCSLLFTESHRFQSFLLVAPTAVWEEFSRIPPTRLLLIRKLHATLENGFMLVSVTRCCPSLIGLEIGLHSTTADITYFDGSCIQMAQLRHLTLYTPSFLESITAPNLHSLMLIEDIASIHSPRTLFPRLSNFLDGSKSALTALDLFWHGTLDELFVILSNMPTLESLSCHPNLDMGFYKRMKLPSSILPMLRTFSLQRHTTLSDRLFAGFFFHTDAFHLIDMVESRLMGGMLESVNVGRLVVEFLSKGEKRP
ncbi:hypothetical protein IW262DRAFT_1418807 [Armillaria fumosa]|nr:hypothetical protein IW262DRAFT_1418807 [Armillaria fumosa]